ncbi:unnamed protein product [Brassicogethes aeneus]|uniref:Peptidase S1 domain-containing protein n=1 Tax=Brassicogethes aeneus TaxID=1431903 RepID=A0A9P0FBW5_BRAAE|nr:unnamed protein product [Brassicogethes aeneus]
MKYLFIFFLGVSLAFGVQDISDRKTLGAIDRSLPTPRQLKIIGGDEAKPHSFPFMVGLIINSNSFCGGTLISENYVLTGAHCAVVIKTVHVLLGAHNISAEEPTQVTIKGEKVTVHPKFDIETFQNDIALIKLSQPVNPTESIQIVNLPTRSTKDNNYYAASVCSLGWGLTEDKSRSSIDDISQVLRFVNVTILDIYSCGEYFNTESKEFINESNFCVSGHKNKGTCSGDSGGPLMHEDVQIGIVSIGSTFCEMCYPSVFTNIAKFLDWIQENSDVIIS